MIVIFTRVSGLSAVSEEDEDSSADSLPPPAHPKKGLTNGELSFYYFKYIFIDTVKLDMLIRHLHNYRGQCKK